MLLSWLVLSAAFYATAALLPGMRIKGASGALTAAAIFGLLNFLLGWLLFTVVGVLSLGLGFVFAFFTRWVVNTVLLKLTDVLTSSVKVKGVGTALLGALLISALGTLGEWVLSLLLV